MSAVPVFQLENKLCFCPPLATCPFFLCQQLSSKHSFRLWFYSLLPSPGVRRTCGHLGFLRNSHHAFPDLGRGLTLLPPWSISLLLLMYHIHLWRQGLNFVARAGLELLGLCDPSMSLSGSGAHRCEPPCLTDLFWKVLLGPGGGFVVGGPRCSLYMVYSLTKLSDPEYERSEAERP